MAGSKQYIYEFEKGDGKNKMLLGSILIPYEYVEQLKQRKLKRKEV